MMEQIHALETAESTQVQQQPNAEQRFIMSDLEYQQRFDENKHADFWVLGEDGRFQPVPIKADGTYLSTVLPSFKLDVTSVLSDSLPSPLKAAAEMVGMDAVMRA